MTDERDDVEFDDLLNVALASSATPASPSPDVRSRLMARIRAAGAAVDIHGAVPNHEPFAELTGSYVLGALSRSERDSFEAHLAGCAACAVEVHALRPVAFALAFQAPPAAPSADARTRLMRSVAATRSARSLSYAPWLAAAASIVIALGLGVYASQLRGRVAVLESALARAADRASVNERLVAEARREAGETRTMLAVLLSPDLARIDLKGQPVAPSASARAFWSRSRGLVFTATNLPALPAGRVYQLWVLTAQPAPINAGILRPDAEGRVTATFNTPPNLPQPVAMAVTIEPEGGVTAPTGDKYLIGTAD